MPWNDDLIDGTPAHTLASIDSKTIRALAGPGTGKSFGIKRRIARLLENGIKPNEILAVTFTRTAANDLKREILSLEIKGANEVHARTIHSYALNILMKADVLSRTMRTPRMVIDHEIAPALRDIDKSHFGDTYNKKNLLQAYLAAWARLQTDKPGFVKDKIEAEFEKDLINWLIYHKGILVGEVIPVSIQFLRDNPSYSEIGRYKVILIDEYQDLNRSEQEFINLIRGNSDIVIVGDDDQSIYSFKFAHPEGIKEIENIYGDYTDVPFKECFRCPQIVTEMASELISKNSNRTLGQLLACASNQKGIVNIVQWNTYDDEITSISSIITDQIQKRVITPGDVLILTPRRRIGYKLRAALAENAIPVKSYFREDIIRKDEVRKAYSLMNLLSDFNDPIALRFLLGCGSNDYLKKQYSKLKEYSDNNKISILELLDKTLKGEIKVKGIANILKKYEEVIKILSELKMEIINDPINGFSNYFIKTPTQEFEFFELNQAYINSITDLGLTEFTIDNFDDCFKKVFQAVQESIALPDSPQDIDHVRVMSLHASKGLSAKFVVLCSMIDNLMPFLKTDIAEEERQKQIEEQRRLFYVAITRCKSSKDYPGRLIISSFLSIYGAYANQMGLLTRPDRDLRVYATRYLRDFGDFAPKSIAGIKLLEEIS